MSYYSNKIKNGLEINADDYKIENHDELDAVNKELLIAQKKLDEVQQKLADKKEKLISSKYYMPPQKRFVLYHRTNTLYDWDTCSPVADTGDAEDPIIIDAYNIKERCSIACGWDLAKGAIIVGEYDIRIETAKQKLHHRFVKQYVWDFTQGCCPDEEYGCYSLSFKSTQKSSQEFVSKFFDCEYTGRYEIRELSDKYQRNQDFEIILKEAPVELVDRLLNLRIPECQPLNKVFKVNRPTYQKMKDEGLLPIMLRLIENDVIVPENENELINILEIAKIAADDFQFYGISTGYHYNRGNDNSTASDIAEDLLKNYYNNERIKKYYTLNKFVDYVIREVINQGYTSLNNFCQELKDYISMCDQQNIKPTLYSSYLKITHDVCARNHKVFLDAHQEEMFLKAYEGWKDEKISGPNEQTKYMIIVPKKSDDIKHEGDNLNHCVGSYIKRVADGICHIFFLRQKEDESLITLEVRNKKICQVRGSHNRSPYPDEIKAIKIWAKKHDIEY